MFFFTVWLVNTWSHNQPLIQSMKKIPGQFEPYKGLFDCSDMTFKQGQYNGTIFRFPLRNNQSLLSSKCLTYVYMYLQE